MNSKEKLKHKIQNKLAHISSIEEIYRNAEDRQNKLFNIVFDKCYVCGLCNCLSRIDVNNIENMLYTLKERNILNNLNIDEIKSIICDTNKSSLNKVKILQEKNYLNKLNFTNRKTAESFLDDNYDIFKVKILDGNVKNIQRTMEKAKDRYNGDFRQVDDINRLTIIADDLNTIEKIIKDLACEFKDDFVAREKWQMKPFGMITRSSYLFINNFPCEIHFNEPKQMSVSKEVTHKIYELYRLNIDDKDRFKNEFINFLDDIQNNKYQGNYQDILNDIVEYNKNNKLNFTNIDEILNTKQLLLDSHIKIHQRKIIEADTSWQITYLVALHDFNKNSKHHQINYTEQYNDHVIKQVKNILQTSKIYEREK